jgi:hypothetical protein
MEMEFVFLWDHSLKFIIPEPVRDYELGDLFQNGLTCSLRMITPELFRSYGVQSEILSVYQTVEVNKKPLSLSGVI